MRRLINFAGIASAIWIFGFYVPLKVGFWIHTVIPQNCHGDNGDCHIVLRWMIGICVYFIVAIGLLVSWWIVYKIWELAGYVLPDKPKNEYLKE